MHTIHRLVANLAFATVFGVAPQTALRAQDTAPTPVAFESINDLPTLPELRQMAVALSLLALEQHASGLTKDGALRLAMPRAAVTEVDRWLDAQTDELVDLLVGGKWLEEDDGELTITREARRWAEALPNPKVTAKDPDAWKKHWRPFRRLATLAKSDVNARRKMLRDIYSLGRRHPLGFAAVVGQAEQKRVAGVLDAILAFGRAAARGKLEIGRGQDMRRDENRPANVGENQKPRDAMTTKGLIEQGLTKLVDSPEFREAETRFDGLSDPVAAALKAATARTRALWANPSRDDALHKVLELWHVAAEKIETDLAERFERLLYEPELRDQLGEFDSKEEHTAIRAAADMWKRAAAQLRVDRDRNRDVFARPDLAELTKNIDSRLTPAALLTNFVREQNGEWADAYAFFEGLDAARRKTIATALAGALLAVDEGKETFATAREFAASILDRLEWGLGKVTRRQWNQLIHAGAQLATNEQLPPSWRARFDGAAWKKLLDELEKKAEGAAKEGWADSTHWTRAKALAAKAWPTVFQALVIREWEARLGGIHRIGASPFSVEFLTPELVADVSGSYTLRFGGRMMLVSAPSSPARPAEAADDDELDARDGMLLDQESSNADEPPAELERDLPAMLSRLGMILDSPIEITIEPTSVELKGALDQARAAARAMIASVRSSAHSAFDSILEAVRDPGAWKYDASADDAAKQRGLAIWGSALAIVQDRMEFVRTADGSYGLDLEFGPLPFASGDERFVVAIRDSEKPAGTDRFWLDVHALYPNEHTAEARAANQAELVRLAKSVGSRFWDHYGKDVAAQLADRFRTIAGHAADAKSLAGQLDSARESLGLRIEKGRVVFRGSLRGEQFDDALRGVHLPYRGSLDFGLDGASLRSLKGDPKIEIDVDASRLHVPAGLLFRKLAGDTPCLRFEELAQRPNHYRVMVQTPSGDAVIASLGVLWFERNGQPIPIRDARSLTEARLRPSAEYVELSLPALAGTQLRARFPSTPRAPEFIVDGALVFRVDADLPFGVGSIENARLTVTAGDGLDIGFESEKASLEPLTRRLRRLGALPGGMRIERVFWQREPNESRGLWLDLAGGDDDFRQRIQPAFQPLSKDSIRSTILKVAERAAEAEITKGGWFHRMLTGKKFEVPPELPVISIGGIRIRTIEAKPDRADGEIIIRSLMKARPFATFTWKKPEPVDGRITSAGLDALEQLVEDRIDVPDLGPTADRIRATVEASEVWLRYHDGWFEPGTGTADSFEKGIPVAILAGERKIDGTRVHMAFGLKGVMPPRVTELEDAVARAIGHVAEAEFKRFLAANPEIQEIVASVVNFASEGEQILQAKLADLSGAVTLREVKPIPGSLPGLARLRKIVDKLPKEQREKLRRILDVPRGYSFTIGLPLGDYHVRLEGAKFLFFGSGSKGFDFSAARVNLEAVEPVLRRIFGQRLSLGSGAGGLSIQLANATTKADGTELRVKWQLDLRELDVVVSGEQAIDLTLHGLRVSRGRDSLAVAVDAIANAVVARLDPVVKSAAPLEILGRDVQLRNPRCSYEQGCVRIDGDVRVELPFELPTGGNAEFGAGVRLSIPIRKDSVPLSLRFDVTRPVDLAALEKALKEAGAAIFGELGEFEFLQSDWIEVREVSPRLTSEGLPIGVEVEAKVNVQIGPSRFGANLPTIRIDKDGVRFDGPSYLSLNASNMPPIPIVPPFEIVVTGAEIGKFRRSVDGRSVERTEVGVLGRGRASATDFILCVDGRFAFDLKKIGNLSAEATLKLVSIPIAHASVTASLLDDMGLRAALSFGGPIRKYVRGEGSLDLLIKKKVLQGELSVYVFNIVNGNAHVLLLIDDARLAFGIEVTIPLNSVAMAFDSGTGFKNPMLRGSTGVELFGFTISGIDLAQSLQQLRAGLTILGIRIGITLPSLWNITPDLLWRLIRNLLFPDLSQLLNALAALLSGDVELNPFAGFGPGGDSFDSGGEDGGQDGDGKASKEGEGRPNGEAPFVSPSAIDFGESEPNAPEATEPTKERSDKAGYSIDGNGKVTDPAAKDSPAFWVKADEKNLYLHGNAEFAKSIDRGVSEDALKKGIPVWAPPLGGSYLVRTDAGTGVFKPWEISIDGGVVPPKLAAHFPLFDLEPNADGSDSGKRSRELIAWVAQMVPTNNGQWAVVVLTGRTKQTARQGWIDASGLGLDANPLDKFKGPGVARVRVLKDLVEHASFRLMLEPKRRWPKRRAPGCNADVGALVDELQRVTFHGNGRKAEALIVRYPFDREYRLFVRHGQESAHPSTFEAADFGLWGRTDLGVKENHSHVKGALSALLDDLYAEEPEDYVGARFVGDRYELVKRDEIRFSDEWEDGPPAQSEIPKPPTPEVDEENDELVEVDEDTIQLVPGNGKPRTCTWTKVGSDRVRFEWSDEPKDTTFFPLHWQPGKAAFTTKEGDALKPVWAVPELGRSGLGMLTEDGKKRFIVVLRGSPDADGKLEAISLPVERVGGKAPDKLDVMDKVLIRGAIRAFLARSPNEQKELGARAFVIGSLGDTCPSLDRTKTPATPEIRYGAWTRVAGERATRRYQLVQRFDNDKGSRHVRSAVSIDGQTALIDALTATHPEVLEDLVLLSIHRRTTGGTLFQFADATDDEFLLLHGGRPELWNVKEKKRARLGPIVRMPGRRLVNPAELRHDAGLFELAVGALKTRHDAPGGAGLENLPKVRVAELDETEILPSMLVEETNAVGEDTRVTALVVPSGTATEKDPDTATEEDNGMLKVAEFVISGRVAKIPPRGDLKSSELYKRIEQIEFVHEGRPNEKLSKTFDRLYAEFAKRKSRLSRTQEGELRNAAAAFSTTVEAARAAAFLYGVFDHHRCHWHRTKLEGHLLICAMWSVRQLEQDPVRVLGQLADRGAIGKRTESTTAKIPALTFTQNLETTGRTLSERADAARISFVRSVVPFWNGWTKAAGESTAKPPQIPLEAARFTPEGSALFALTYAPSEAEILAKLGLGSATFVPAKGALTVEPGIGEPITLTDEWPWKQAREFVDDKAARSRLYEVLLAYVEARRNADSAWQPDGDVFTDAAVWRREEKGAKAAVVRLDADATTTLHSVDGLGVLRSIEVDATVLDSREHDEAIGALFGLPFDNGRLAVIRRAAGRVDGYALAGGIYAVAMTADPAESQGVSAPALRRIATYSGPLGASETEALGSLLEHFTAEGRSPVSANGLTVVDAEDWLVAWDPISDRATTAANAEGSILELECDTAGLSDLFRDVEYRPTWTELKSLPRGAGPNSGRFEAFTDQGRIFVLARRSLSQLVGKRLRTGIVLDVDARPRDGDLRRFLIGVIDRTQAEPNAAATRILALGSAATPGDHWAIRGGSATTGREVFHSKNGLLRWMSLESGTSGAPANARALLAGKRGVAVIARLATVIGRVRSPDESEQARSPVPFHLWWNVGGRSFAVGPTGSWTTDGHRRSLTRFDPEPRGPTWVSEGFVEGRLTGAPQRAALDAAITLDSKTTNDGTPWVRIWDSGVALRSSVGFSEGTFVDATHPSKPTWVARAALPRGLDNVLTRDDESLGPLALPAEFRQDGALWWFGRAGEHELLSLVAFPVRGAAPTWTAGFGDGPDARLFVASESGGLVPRAPIPSALREPIAGRVAATESLVLRLAAADVLTENPIARSLLSMPSADSQERAVWWLWPAQGGSDKVEIVTFAVADSPVEHRWSMRFLDVIDDAWHLVSLQQRDDAVVLASACSARLHELALEAASGPGVELDVWATRLVGPTAGALGWIANDGSRATWSLWCRGTDGMSHWIEAGPGVTRDLYRTKSAFPIDGARLLGAPSLHWKVRSLLPIGDRVHTWKPSTIAGASGPRFYRVETKRRRDLRDEALLFPMGKTWRAFWTRKPDAKAHGDLSESMLVKLDATDRARDKPKSTDSGREIVTTRSGDVLAIRTSRERKKRGEARATTFAHDLVAMHGNQWVGVGVIHGARTAPAVGARAPSSFADGLARGQSGASWITPHARTLIDLCWPLLRADLASARRGEDLLVDTGVHYEPQSRPEASPNWMLRGLRTSLLSASRGTWSLWFSDTAAPFEVTVVPRAVRASGDAFRVVAVPPWTPDSPTSPIENDAWRTIARKLREASVDRGVLVLPSAGPSTGVGVLTTGTESPRVQSVPLSSSDSVARIDCVLPIRDETMFGHFGLAAHSLLELASDATQNGPPKPVRLQIKPLSKGTHALVVLDHSDFPERAVVLVPATPSGQGAREIEFHAHVIPADIAEADSAALEAVLDRIYEPGFLVTSHVDARGVRTLTVIADGTLERWHNESFVKVGRLSDAAIAGIRKLCASALPAGRCQLATDHEDRDVPGGLLPQSGSAPYLESFVTLMAFHREHPKELSNLAFHAKGWLAERSMRHLHVRLPWAPKRPYVDLGHRDQVKNLVQPILQQRTSSLATNWFEDWLAQLPTSDTPPSTKELQVIVRLLDR